MGFYIILHSLYKVNKYLPFKKNIFVLFRQCGGQSSFHKSLEWFFTKTFPVSRISLFALQARYFVLRFPLPTLSDIYCMRKRCPMVKFGKKEEKVHSYTTVEGRKDSFAREFDS